MARTGSVSSDMMGTGVHGVLGTTIYVKVTTRHIIACLQNC